MRFLVFFTADEAFYFWIEELLSAAPLTIESLMNRLPYAPRDEFLVFPPIEVFGTTLAVSFFF
jgi:hypothetical protein